MQSYRDQTDAWLVAQIAKELPYAYKKLATQLTAALKQGGLPALLKRYDEMMPELVQGQEALAQQATLKARQQATAAFTKTVQTYYGEEAMRSLVQPKPGESIDLPRVLQRLGKAPAGRGSRDHVTRKDRLPVQHALLAGRCRHAPGDDHLPAGPPEQGCRGDPHGQGVCHLRRR